LSKIRTDLQELEVSKMQKKLLVFWLFAVHN